MKRQRTGKPRATPFAIADTAFLMREEMRSQRLVIEFDRAELTLQDHGIKSTVVVFGSARVGSPVSRRARPRKFSEHWYEEARAFGRIVSERAGALTPTGGILENVVTTGGGPGIMEAANRGAAEAGAPTIGLNIELPEEQEPNPHITPGLCISFRYFAVRKMHFAMRANALA